MTRRLDTPDRRLRNVEQTVEDTRRKALTRGRPAPQPPTSRAVGPTVVPSPTLHTED